MKFKKLHIHDILKGKYGFNWHRHSWRCFDGPIKDKYEDTDQFTCTRCYKIKSLVGLRKMGYDI